MTALIVLFALYLLGLLVGLAWGPRRYLELCACLAFPLGTLVASALLLGALYVDLPPRLVVGAGVLAAAALAIRGLRQTWSPRRRDLLIAGGGALAFLVVSVALTLRDPSTASFASYKLILVAQVVGEGGSAYDARLFTAFSELGGLTLAAHGLADLVRLDYLGALQPALYVTTGAFGLALIGRAGAMFQAPRSVVLGAAITAGAMLVQPAMVHAGFAIGSAAFVATYSVIAVGLWWLAEQDRDARGARLPLLCLAALFFLSDWGAVIGVGLFAVLVLPSRLDARPLNIPVGAIVAAAVAWLGSAAQTFSDADAPVFFTRSEAQTSLVAVLAVYLLWLALRGKRLAGHIRRLPPWGLSLAILIAFLALAALLGAYQGIGSTWSALKIGGGRLTIVALASCSLIGLWVRPMPGERLFLLGSVLYSGALLWVGATAEDHAFRPPLGEVQRIASPLVLFLLLQVALKVVWLCSESPLSSPRQSSLAPSGTLEIGIATVSLLSALIVFNVHQSRVLYSLGHPRGPGGAGDEPLAVTTRSTRNNTLRQQYALYFAAKSRLEGRLRLPTALEEHAPVLRLFAELDVELGPALLPAQARARLADEIDETVEFRVRRGDNRDVHMILEPRARDWVLALTPDDGPLYLLPRSLYVEMGGAL